MPKVIKFKKLTGSELVREFGRVKKFKTKHPKQLKSRSQQRSAFKTWQKRQSVPTGVRTREGKITAVRLRSSDVSKLREITESTAPTAEAIGQKMGPNQILGTLYSSLTALTFYKMESEYKKRLRGARSPIARKRVESEWKVVLKAGQQAYASAGLRNQKETDLRKYSKELRRNRANFNSVAKIAYFGVLVGASSKRPLTKNTIILGGWVPQVGVIRDLIPITGIVIENLCSRPFAEGVFTKHYSKSFNLTVRLRVWCPTWRKPWRTCVKSFTLAGVSFSLDLEVGYRVTCCGAIVWGQASVQACGTIIGITVCAQCTAKITGVAGFGRSGSGNNCTYGIGVNAQLKCTFAGITVFQVQVPFGYNVSGPCPPIGLC